MPCSLGNMDFELDLGGIKDRSDSLKHTVPVPFATARIDDNCKTPDVYTFSESYLVSMPALNLTSIAAMALRAVFVGWHPHDT